MSKIILAGLLALASVAGASAADRCLKVEEVIVTPYRLVVKGNAQTISVSSNELNFAGAVSQAQTAYIAGAMFCELPHIGKGSGGGNLHDYRISK